MSPLLRWAGSKRQLASRIVDLIGPCEGLYYEPFFGAGAVFFAGDFAHPMLTDANERLVSFHIMVQTKPRELHAIIKQLPWGEGARDAYNDIRDWLNSSCRTGDHLDGALFLAALFYWLNKHGFNGLYRENASGDFNVPVGKSKTPPRCAELSAFLEASRKLTPATIMAMKFAGPIDNAGPGDVIYADPPYVELSDTANFASFVAGGFSFSDQIKLAAALTRAASRGATVIASNHDVPKVRELYGDFGFELISVEVQRSIANKAEARKKAPELLMIRRGT